MKPYTIDILIECPCEQVASKFENTENLFHWQTGLQSIEHLSGEPWSSDAKTRLVFIAGRHQIELVETVIKNDLPDEFFGRYEWNGGMNTLSTRFIAVDDKQTRMQCTCAYELSKPLVKLMGFLFPGKFKEQNLGFMKNFKQFCEC